MIRKGMGLVFLAVLGGFAGGLASGGFFNPNPVLAQDDSIAGDLERQLQRMHEKELAQIGARKMQVSPVDPNRCIGLSVVAAPGNGAVRVFRTFEDGRVELFKQPTGIGQSTGWGVLGQPGYTP